MGKRIVTITNLRGGRNGADAPTDATFPDHQCVDALNVDWSEGALGRRRGGSTAVATTGGTAFSNDIYWLFSHTIGAQPASPGQPAAFSSQELWAIDNHAISPILKRLAAGTTWADVTVHNSFFASDQQHTVGCSFNGKLFMSYHHASQDRLFVYDPGLSAPAVRRVGIAPGSTAPTVADDAAAGTYAATLRYYRVRFLQLTGSVVTRRSEPTPSVSFTPVGNKTYAVITRPTAPSEQETHWEIDVSTDNIVWYTLVSQYDPADSDPIAIATTTYSDDFASSEASYSTLHLSDPEGTYELLPSVKHLVTDGNRLVMAGAWLQSGAQSGGKNARIWFTPVLGTSDQGDDERLVNTPTQKNWLDLNENDGGHITGLSTPLHGVIFAFKMHQIWSLTPTGEVSAPYVARKVSDSVGCCAAKSIVNAVDELGRPAVYFLSTEGPYRIGSGGLEYLGRDIEDIWYGRGAFSAFKTNLSATTMVAFGLFHAPRNEIIWWLSIGSNNAPTIAVVLNINQTFKTQHFGVRGGWSRWSGDVCTAICAVPFANTLGAVMSSDLKPYVGLDGSAVILKTDTTDTNDNGTAFQAFVKTKSLVSADATRMTGVEESTLIARANSACTIRQSLIRDFGLETITSDVVLTAAASETHVMKKFESGLSSQVGVLQVQLGDTGSVSIAPWSLESLSLPLHDEGPR